MFRVSQHPSSGVLKTITEASSTATSLQCGLIRPRWREVAVPILWPIPEVEQKHTKLNRSIQSWTEAYKVEQKHTKLNRSIQRWTEAFKVEHKHTKLNRSIQSWTEAYKVEQKHTKLNRSIQTMQTYFDVCWSVHHCGNWRIKTN